MQELYKELSKLLTDFDKDRQHVTSNTDLLLGYADDFYDMLNRLKEKLSSFMYE